MSLTKFASFEVSKVLDIKSSPEKAKQASLRNISDFHDYNTDDGYLYVRIRAISSRVNKNHDGWPTIELAGGREAWNKISATHQSAEGFRVEADTSQEYGYPTFIGKPIFVDHNNSNPKRARGVIADSAFNVLNQHTAAEGDDYWGSDDVDPEHFPPAEIELLLEVDAKEFPKFAKEIINGDLDGFSMGCDVDYSKCSHCGHEATSPAEYCSHIVMKGAEHTIESGKKKGKVGRSYENCYGVKFFEISGVFDPADETALAKEVRAAKVAALEKEADDDLYNDRVNTREMQCPYCSGVGCEKCGGHGSVTVGAGDDGTFVLDQQPMMGQPVAGPEINLPPNLEHLHQGIYGPEIHEEQGSIAVPHLTLPSEELRRKFPNLPRPIQGSYLAHKLADNAEPQNEHVKAPEDVNTLRQERICPLCGSDMDAEKCDVCGYEEPPESLQNPDLDRAHEMDQQQGTENELAIPQEGQQPEEGAPPQQVGQDGSYLQTRNNQPTASVISSMRWTPKGIDKLAADKPQGDEPNETVTDDQTQPVTSAFRTAQQMIADAAKRNQEKNMSDQTKVAADPADPSGKAEKRVDVTGVGGVDEASNEEASKPEGKHGQPGVTVDVTGKGGVLQDSNAEASKPDETQSVEQTSDNAGFDDGGDKSNNSGPTKTWDNSNEPDSAVTDKAVQAAKKGTDPADPVGKADERIDVEAPPHDRTGPETDQWTGTGGNGVTKQQNPVTQKVDPNIEQPKAAGFISLAALRLADTEVDLGITEKSDKYNRLAELAELSDEEIVAEQRALSKVKTAGLTRTAAKSNGLPTGRVPSFQRIAREETPESQPVDDALLDNALFTR